MLTVYWRFLWISLKTLFISVRWILLKALDRGGIKRGTDWGAISALLCLPALSTISAELKHPVVHRQSQKSRFYKRLSKNRRLDSGVFSG